MERRALELDESLGAANEAQWDRLRSQLALAEGFWLGFVFSPSPRSAMVLRERTERILRARTKTLLLIQPATPKGLRDVLQTLVDDDAPARAGCTWIEAVRSDSLVDREQPLTAAWDELFLRMNVRRDVLRRRLPGGLVFAAPPEIKPRVREAAPDLWSVRSMVVDLEPARPPLASEPPNDLTEATLLEFPALAPDPQLALDEAARRHARGDVASQARALLQATEGLLAEGRVHEARRSAREAWTNLAGLGSLEEAEALALLARAERLDGDPAAAADHLQQAIEKRRGSDPGSIPLDWYYLGGGLARGRSDLATARALYEEAAQVARARMERLEGAETLRDFSIALGKLGRIQREMGDLTAAASSFEESLAIAQRLHDVDGNAPLALRDLSLALTNLAKIRREVGDLAAAAAAVEGSLTLCRRLYDLDGGSARSLRDLFLSLTNAGTIWREAGDVAAATAAFEESLALHTRLRELHGDAPYALRELSVALDSVGKMRREAGDLAEATSAFEESLALRRRQRELHGDTPQVLRDLAVALNSLGTIRRAAGDRVPACSAFQESLEILRRLDELRHDSPQTLRDLSIALSNLGEVQREAGDLSAAKRLLDEAHSLRQRLRELHDDTAQGQPPQSAPSTCEVPKRVHITTGLQEAHLPSLGMVEQLCSQMYDALGFDTAEVPTRLQADLIALARRDKIYVFEADNRPSGFLAWHDESPGVAYLVDVQVHPDLQRLGFGSDLLDKMREDARALKLEQIVVRCWEKASWAMSFFRRQRFMPIDTTAPNKVSAWKDERLATGKPLVRPGEVALWSPIGSAPKVMTDDEMDMAMTLLTGEIPNDIE